MRTPTALIDFFNSMTECLHEHEPLLRLAHTNGLPASDRFPREPTENRCIFQPECPLQMDRLGMRTASIMKGNARDSYSWMNPPEIAPSFRSSQIAEACDTHTSTADSVIADNEVDFKMEES